MLFALGDLILVVSLRFWSVLIIEALWGTYGFVAMSIHFCDDFLQVILFLSIVSRK